MVRCEMTYRQDIYETDYEGDFKYEIMSEYNKNISSDNSIYIRRMAKVGYGHWIKLCEYGWTTDQEVRDENGSAKIFKSVEEAFGFINNIINDDIAIGTPVHISTGSDRDHQEWDGVVVVNDRYNDDYPYKVEVPGKNSYGVFAADEISVIK